MAKTKADEIFIENHPVIQQIAAEIRNNIINKHVSYKEAVLALDEAKKLIDNAKIS